MSTKKNKVICPYCGAEKRRTFAYEPDERAIMSLTAWEYPTDKVTITCDECGVRYEVRGERCIIYRTKKVTA